MEQLSASLQVQKKLAIEQAEAMLDFCVTGAGLPDGRQDDNLRNIAWYAAYNGLWEAFAEKYDGDANSDFIPAKGEEKALWVKQFADGQDFETAETLAESIKAKKARATAQNALAFCAAKTGDGELAERYGAAITNSEMRQRLTDTTFTTLASMNEWEKANELFTSSKLSTYALLHVAGEAANQGEFDYFIAFANQGAKQGQEVRERGDPENGDWLRGPVETAARTAFIQGAYGFIASLHEAIEWPKDAKAEVEAWINNGVLNGIYESEDYAAGINMFAAKAIEEGDDQEAYTILQDALDERHWDLIEIIAPRLNSEILGMLHRLAYSEEQSDAAMKLNDISRRKDGSDNNYMLISDHAAPTMIEEAAKGNWEQALDLRHSIARRWAYDNMKQLIKLAVRQERYDLLPVLTEKSEALLEAAVNTTDSRAAFDESDNLLEEWLTENEDVIDEKELMWLKFGLLNHRAPVAAYFGDWQRASQSLQEMDDIAKETGESYGHGGYAFVAIEALKLLKAAKASNGQP
jgi:hypothetical protein